MSDPRIDNAGDRRVRPREEQPVQYPENRMLAILDTRDQVRAAMDALTSGGFLPSEIEILRGATAAKKLQEETGRTGLANLAMRFVEKIGLPNDELALKNHYAEALADGRFLIAVSAPTEDRKRVAAKLLTEHGGQDVRFFSRYTITSPARAD
jgi:hypothetical protein